MQGDHFAKNRGKILRASVARISTSEFINQHPTRSPLYVIFDFFFLQKFSVLLELSGLIPVSVRRCPYKEKKDGTLGR